MKTEFIKNSEGEILKSKEGKELKDNTLEVGDEFIPTMNKVIEKSHEAIVNGKKQLMTRYSIRARVRGKDKQPVKVDGEEEIWIKLTPTQANSLNKKIESGIEINQHLFSVYTYFSQKYGEQIGVGLKGQFKPPKTFEDFENVNFTDAIDLEAIEEEDFPNV